MFRALPRSSGVASRVTALGIAALAWSACGPSERVGRRASVTDADPTAPPDGGGGPGGGGAGGRGGAGATGGAGAAPGTAADGGSAGAGGGGDAGRATGGTGGAGGGAGGAAGGGGAGGTGSAPDGGGQGGIGGARDAAGPVGGAGGNAGTGGRGGGAGTPGTGGNPGGRDGGPPPPADGGPSPRALPLPLVVTDHFENQGWFGDPVISAHFTPGSMLIRQVVGTTGPCAARPAGARGRCLEITYTPPPGIAVGPGSFAGVYFLRTLLVAHPEAVPPARAGEANWGLEPGIEVVPGATRISFQAVASAADTRVSFQAGTMNDTFVLTEQVEALTTSWTRYSLPLGASRYTPSLIGPFAWFVRDTSKPVVFYLDDVVWE